MAGSVAAQDDLQQIVEDEAFLWGSEMRVDYHARAEREMDQQWRDIIWPVLSKYNIDYSDAMDFACGHGRNAIKLSELAQRVTLVDVNPENIAFCRERFIGDRYSFVVTSGYDLRAVADASLSFIYSFDAMVHFDLAIVHAYVAEFARVLRPGGYGFIHHSNHASGFGCDFRQDPGWRHFNSAEIFASLCARFGLEICEQKLLDWGAKDHDCLTVFRKPATLRQVPPGDIDQHWLRVLRVAQQARPHDELLRLSTQVQQLQAESRALKSTRSWRITQPLRWGLGQVYWLRRWLFPFEP